MEIINWLKGKKTFILSFIGIIYALSAWVTGHMSGMQALQDIWGTGSLAAIRAAFFNSNIQG